MNDIGMLHQVALEGTISVPVVCRNGSSVSTEPDSDPTYTVFDGTMTQVGSQTGSMALTPGSKTGFRAVTLTASAANGYAAKGLYTVHIDYEISSVLYSVIATFRVS